MPLIKQIGKNKLKLSELTVILFSLFVLMLGVVVTVSLFTEVPDWMTRYGAFIIMIFGIALLLETWLEGQVPDLRKDTAALIGTLIGVVTVIIGLYELINQPFVLGSEARGVIIALNWVLLARELIAD